MFNADLAERASKLLSNSRILSSTAGAAPYFAAEALGVATEPARHVWGRQLILDSATDGDGLVNALTAWNWATATFCDRSRPHPR
jgi:hypothetical protein